MADSSKRQRRAHKPPDTSPIRPIRVAYADPPYPGSAHIYSVPGTPEYHPDAARWDDPAEHVALMARLEEEFPDGAPGAGGPEEPRMTDRSDLLGAMARHVNGSGPLAPFLEALTDSSLHELASLASSELRARVAAREATRCDHPPKPGCDSCGGPTDNRTGFDGIAHTPTCAATIERARGLVYHPSVRVRLWAADVLNAAAVAPRSGT